MTAQETQTIAIARGVFRLVTAAFDVTAASIQEHNRTLDATPRWVIAFLLINHTTISKQDTSTIIKRDYSSLYHMLKKVTTRRAKDPAFDKLITFLIKRTKSLVAQNS